MHTTKGNPDGTNRTTAIIVGILYILGTVAGILSVVFTQPILGDPDFLVDERRAPGFWIDGIHGMLNPTPRR